jgi:hypothetical protein
LRSEYYLILTLILGLPPAGSVRLQVSRYPSDAGVHARGELTRETLSVRWAPNLCSENRELRNLYVIEATPKPFRHFQRTRVTRQ